MRRCMTCEGLLTDSHFEGDGPVCTVCVGKLQKVYHVEYSIPERKTVKEAYISLLAAIREQAVKDNVANEGALKEWEDYWLYAERWSRVWNLLEYTMDQSQHVTVGFSLRVGRHL